MYDATGGGQWFEITTPASFGKQNGATLRSLGKKLWGGGPKTPWCSRTGQVGPMRC